MTAKAAVVTPRRASVRAGGRGQTVLEGAVARTARRVGKRARRKQVRCEPEHHIPDRREPSHDPNRDAEPRKPRASMLVAARLHGSNYRKAARWPGRDEVNSRTSAPPGTRLWGRSRTSLASCEGAGKLQHHPAARGSSRPGVPARNRRGKGTGGRRQATSSPPPPPPSPRRATVRRGIRQAEGGIRPRDRPRTGLMGSTNGEGL